MFWFFSVACINVDETRQTVYVYRNIEARSRNHCCRGKAVRIKYYECVSLAFVIKHAMRMRHITLSYVACLALSYFFTLSRKGHDFRGKNYWK